MSDLRELYQEVILDHSKPAAELPQAAGTRNLRGHGDNPLCGDQLTVYLKVKDGHRRGRRFRGHGLCDFDGVRLDDDRSAQRQDGSRSAGDSSTASTMHMTGKSACRRRRCRRRWRSFTVLSGVREFPVRVKCATLPWHTLMAALDHTE